MGDKWSIGREVEHWEPGGSIEREVEHWGEWSIGKRSIGRGRVGVLGGEHHFPD